MDPTNREQEPSIQEQTAFYDRWNSEHRGGALEQIEPEIRARGERVAALLRRKLQPGARILEVGCGTGWMSALLAPMGRLTATDLSPRAIEIARDRGFDAEYFAADFLEHDFAGRRFDAVVCVETLFYVADQERFTRKMAELLDAGGVLALTAINKYVYERSSSVGKPATGQVRHWLSRGALRKLLRAHFDIVEEATLAPRGDLGLLRIVNSYRVNAVLDRVLGSARVRALKERAGLGGGIVILATKR